MQFIATQKQTRQSPRKVLLVASQVRKLPLEEAIRQLAVIRRRSTEVILKVLKQAIANAKNDHNVAFGELVLKDIVVMEGPRFKRFNAVSRGRAHGYVKRTSHVRVVLETKPVVADATKTVEKPAEKVVSTAKTAKTKKVAGK